ncbi:MAG: dienelactone hydrolase family protein [Vulcanimicrobiaceae bacterium]
MIEFSRPDGNKAPGYLAEPASGSKAPGVVMLEEWWGVNEQIKETADLLASQGFRVLVPDLYRGRVAATGDEANHLMQGLDFGDAATQDARGAASFLKSTGSQKVGVTGFCMGGALTLLSAMHVPDYDAAVVWYGFPPEEAGDPATIKIPLMLHWAIDDEFFPIDRADRIEERLVAGHVPHQTHRYKAKHAFYNPGGLGNHDPQNAQKAWERTVDFFKTNLA